MCLKSSTQNLLNYINMFVVVCTHTRQNSLGLCTTYKHFDDSVAIGYFKISTCTLNPQDETFETIVFSC